MPYQVTPARLGALLEGDPSTYRPLLDYVASAEALPEEAQAFENWTRAKEYLDGYLETLRQAARRRAGPPPGRQLEMFAGGSEGEGREERGGESHKEGSENLTSLQLGQLDVFSLRDLLLMQRHLQAARFEEVDSRFESIPF